MCRHVFAIAVVLALTGCVSASGQTLVWDPNTESDLAGYRVYQGNTSRSYSASFDVGNTTSYTFARLAPGTWYFAVTAYNTSGLESGFSNEVSTRVGTDTTPPVLTSRASRILTNDAATISWTTNEPATASIEYGTSESYGSVISTAGASAAQSLRLAGLAAATTYHYRITIRDALGNVSVTQDESFSTAPPPESIMAAKLSAYPHPVSDVPYVGLGLSNTGNEAAGVRLTAFDEGGQSVAGPLALFLAPGEQVVGLDAHIFGADINASGAAWIKVESSTAEVAGLFFGLNDGPTKMDGGTLQASGQSEFVLPGPGVFNVINPHQEACVATLQLIDSDGTPGDATKRVIPAHGSLSTNAGALFESAAASGYVRVSTNQNVFSFVAALDTADLVGLEPGLQAGGFTPVLYAPDFIGGGGWRSTITVVNTDNLPGLFTARLFDDAGTPIGGAVSFQLSARGIVRITESDLFAPDPEKATRGYVEISTNAALAASLTIQFKDQAASAFRLITVPRRSFVIGQVASDSDYYTGAALLNPGPDPASVTLELHLSDGRVAGIWSGTVLPRQRVLQLMTQFFPAIAGDNISSGYVKVTADRAIAALALFGRNDLSVLSAIPPD